MAYSWNSCFTWGGAVEGEFAMDLSGWILRVARGITADGTMICGDGVYWSGDRYLGRSFVAVSPAPSGAAVLVGAGLLACRRGVAPRGRAPRR